MALPNLLDASRSESNNGQSKVMDKKKKKFIKGASEGGKADKFKAMIEAKKEQGGDMKKKSRSPSEVQKAMYGKG